MYGSSFWIETLIPRALSSRPSDAAVIPLPSELTTPPVKKIYFAISGCLYSLLCHPEPVEGRWDLDVQIARLRRVVVPDVDFCVRQCSRRQVAQRHNRRRGGFHEQQRPRPQHPRGRREQLAIVNQTVGAPIER